jgi:RND superfamily putative drug exporter
VPSPATAHTSESALGRLGALAGRRPRTVVLVWVVAVLASFAAATGALGGESLFERLHAGEPEVAGENMAGRDLLARSGASARSTSILQVTGVDPRAEQVVRAASASAQRLSGLPGVAEVASPYLVPGGPADPAARPLLAGGDPAGGGFATVVIFEQALEKGPPEQSMTAVDREFERLVDELPAGASGRSGGLHQLIEAITDQIKADLRTGEGIALPLSFLVMVVVFGGFVAAGMPIVGAVASIAGGLASLLAFSYVIDLDATVVNVVTVLGLGLCIDYGLLTVSRFREELRALARGIPASDISGDQIVAATARTVHRAGRTVVFSALTVAISLGGLLFFEASIMKAVGAAGLSVVLVAMLVALVLVPALCALGARRLLSGGTEQAPDEGVFSRLASWVNARPVPVIVGVLAVLTALALPALGLRLTSSGEELLPRGSEQRVFFETLARDYPALTSPEVRVVAQAPLAEVRAWAENEAPALPGVTAVEPPREVGDGVAVVGLRTGDGGLGDPSRDLVSTLREDRPPFPAHVVGQASGLHDFTQSMLAQAPLAFGVVALATLVLLFVMTGSVVVPVKALMLNVVSLGAALGVIVWVFQDGHLEGLLGFDSVGAIESTIPLLVLSFGFGLSMDYEVFLLSRIVELHEQGHGNSRAVVLGLQRSGRIITSAALLVIIVFSGFVAGELLVVKETGVGLVVAVLLDATLVRMLLVPATMTLLGDRNWWAPPALRRWHERYGITE